MPAGSRVVIVDVAAFTRVDVATADALARLEVTARRNGCRLLVRNASADLRGLLRLCGLDQVLWLCDSDDAG